MDDFKTQKEKIFKNFNFDKVYEAMHDMDWTWLGEVITIDSLKECANEILDDLESLPEDYSCVSSGGFMAQRIHGHYKLFFVVEDSFIKKFEKDEESE